MSVCGYEFNVTQFGYDWCTKKLDHKGKHYDSVSGNSYPNTGKDKAPAAQEMVSNTESEQEACSHCNGNGGWLVNPDWPMGDCGEREWVTCSHCNSPSRKDELWSEHMRWFNHVRYGSPQALREHNDALYGPPW